MSLQDSAGSKPSLIQVAFPHRATTVFFSALVVGAAMIALPLFDSVDASRGDLILCAGVAIVLAAFGGQATVQIGGVIMAGVAAISVGLFIYLESLTTDAYARGSINGINALKYDVAMKTRNNIFGAVSPIGTDPRRARYDFVLFKSELDTDAVQILVSIKQSGDVQPGEDRVARVPSAEFEKYIGTGRRLDWQLKPKIADNDIEFEVWDNASHKLISVERVAVRRPNPWPFARYINRALEYTGFVGTALAQSASAETTNKLVEQLKSDDTTTRRAARDALANLPVESVPSLMATLRSQLTTYRVKLGILVAFSDMLRKDRAKAKQISARLTDADLGLLLSLTGDPDRTVRVYATQFLSDLSDPRQAKLGVEKALATDDEKTMHNQLLAIQQSFKKLPPNERLDLNKSLNEIKARSDVGIKSLIDTLQKQ